MHALRHFFFTFLTYSYNIYHKLCKQQTVSNTNKCVEDEAVEVDYETDDV